MSEAAKLARDLFGAFQERDISTASALISESAVWEFPGRRGALSGRHEGREAVFRFLFKASTLTDGTFHADISEIVGNDRVAYMRFTGRARRGERQLENDTCLRLEFEAGKMVAAQEWVWDLSHVEDFWG